MTEHSQPPAPRILVVEDQDDIRLMLVTVLQMEGYHVDDVANAEEGLRALQAGHFDLVLTDYAMPGGTGTWMLQEAVKAGRLEQTPALVITAHPEVLDGDPSAGGTPSPFPVVSKPIDLDRFLEQVRRILKMSEAVPGLRRTPALAKIELVLYVSAASPASMHARRNIEQTLSGFEPGDIAFSICDLQRNPEAAEADRVTFTPTLVKRHPGPRMWIIGDLRDGEVVADLLRICGVTPRP
ncbi:MAG: response regulator [Acidobacteriota bacterium]|nr:response regulator [Acidobacteriota bacterium]